MVRPNSDNFDTDRFSSQDIAIYQDIYDNFKYFHYLCLNNIFLVGSSCIDYLNT